MRQGEAQMQEGNWGGAVTTYRTLCQEGGRHAEDACNLLMTAERELQGTAISEARLQMWDHNYEQAFQTLYDAKALLSSTNEIEEVEQEVLAEGVQFYTRKLSQEEYRLSYEGAIMLNSLYPDDEDAQQIRNDSASAYNESLLYHAEQARTELLDGATIAYLVTAYEIIPDASIATQIEELRTTLNNTLRIGYHVEVAGRLNALSPPTLPAEVLAENVSQEHALLSLQATLNDIRFNETYTSAILQHPYLAGTEWVSNPDYAAAQSRVESQARLVNQQTQEVNRTRSELQTAQRNASNYANTVDEYHYNSLLNQAQSNFDQAQRQLNSSQSNYENATNTLARTPATVEREIWDNYDYEHRAYTRTATADLNINARLQETNTNNHDTISTRTTDGWHEGHSRYNLASDPLHYNQDDRTMENIVIESAFNSVQAQLLIAFERYREQFLPAFQNISSPELLTIDQLTRYILFYPTNVPIEVQTWIHTYLGLADSSHLATVP